MSNLYNRIYDLCQKRGMSVGKMCAELNIRRSNLTELKMGRIKTLKADNLTKIASFFDVTVDFLLGAEKAPTPESERQISEEELMAAFFNGGAENLTKEEMAEMWEDARSYIQYKLEQKRRKNNV